MSGRVKTRILFRSKHFNIYLVSYPEGHQVRPHVDMVAQGKLYKLNCVLARPQSGGTFVCEKKLFDLFGRVVLFRPDLYEHQVEKITRGKRLLLSFALNV